MDKKRLLELAGMQLNEGLDFHRESDMLVYIVRALKRIKDDNNPDANIDDIRNGIDDLLDKIENASVTIASRRK